MILYNEKLQLITDQQAFIEQLKKEYDQEPDRTQEELEQMIGEAYFEALKEDAEKNFSDISTIAASQAASPQMLALTGGSIFGKIRKAVCFVINALSTVDEIIAAVLDAVSTLFPLGKIVAWLVKRIIKFVITRGYAWLCPVGA